MNDTRPASTKGPLADSPVSVRAKIAAAWTSIMFLYIYVDYYGLYKPGTVDDILIGIVFEFDISPAILTVFLALLAIPALMVVLSTTLPARVNRATNLIVALLYIPFSAFNATGESPEWLIFYGLAIAIEVGLLIYILRAAWTWPRTNSDVAVEATAELRH